LLQESGFTLTVNDPTYKKGYTLFVSRKCYFYEEMLQREVRASIDNHWININVEIKLVH